MVVFTCINCGESLKKTVVQKHYMGRCRGPPNVTCVDCLKDFRGNDYEAHTKCVTEEERYSAKGFVPKPTSNKGEKKQQSWCEAIQSILETNSNLKNDERQFLSLLSNHENVPRKKGKFMNFVANAHRPYAKRQELVDRVWAIIEEAGKAPSEPEKSVEEAKDEEPTKTVPEEKSSKKKRKNSEINDEATENLIDESNNETPKKKKSKKEKKTLAVEEQEAPEINAEDDKVSKKKKKETSVANGVEEVVNGIEDSKKTKKHKKSVNGDGIAATANGEQTSNLLIELVEKAGGSTTLHKLLQGLSEFCSSEVGEGKAEKALKKLHKQIIVTLTEGSVSLTYPCT